MHLDKLPDVSFAQKSIEEILADTISGYEKAYYEQTGEVKKLFPGDPIRIWLYSQALREFQLRQLIDYSAKQNLLKYAKGPFLDHKGADHDVPRADAKKATVTMKYILSTPLPTIQYIPAGTRVRSKKDVYFQTLETIEVPAGATEVIAVNECTVAGEIGNGFTPGQINTLVDPIPWIANVENIDTSQGGADEEGDESYRERINLAPEGYSTAGPELGYEFFAKKYSQLIEDVAVSSPGPGTVDIRVLLKNGEIPEQTFLDGLKDYISAKDKRPLTDYVSVGAPDIVNYNINLTYYIRTEDETAVTSIRQRVDNAVSQYQVWQKSKIGRDINPSELIARVIQAGAKRIEIVEPVFAKLEKNQVAVAENVSVTYGGLEDD